MGTVGCGAAFEVNIWNEILGAERLRTTERRRNQADGRKMGVWIFYFCCVVWGSPSFWSVVIKVRREGIFENALRIKVKREGIF